MIPKAEEVLDDAARMGDEPERELEMELEPEPERELEPEPERELELEPEPEREPELEPAALTSPSVAIERLEGAFTDRRCHGHTGTLPWVSHVERRFAIAHLRRGVRMRVVS